MLLLKWKRVVIIKTRLYRQFAPRKNNNAYASHPLAHRQQAGAWLGAKMWRICRQRCQLNKKNLNAGPLLLVGYSRLHSSEFTKFNTKITGKRKTEVDTVNYFYWFSCDFESQKRWYATLALTSSDSCLVAPSGTSATNHLSSSNSVLRCRLHLPPAVGLLVSCCSSKFPCIQSAQKTEQKIVRACGGSRVLKRRSGLGVGQSHERATGGLMWQSSRKRGIWDG